MTSTLGGAGSSGEGAYRRDRDSFYGPMMAEFAELVRPNLESRLEPDEHIKGIIAATFQKTFSGGLYAIGVTDRRLLLQPLDRRMQPKGDLRAIGPDTLRSAELDGAGGGWWTAPAAILDATALALTIQTTDGVKLTLSMMKGTGLLGGLGGGQAQRDGILALTDWMQRNLGQGSGR
jgi:hypothetical protein